MNEPPGARARVALTGLTVAEYFRDEEGQDVLLFIDNIFRLVLLAFSLFFFLKICQNGFQLPIFKLVQTNSSRVKLFATLPFFT